MTTTSRNYSANVALTIGLGSLASSATFIAGRESNQVDNTSNLYDDVIVSGRITVGTTPTASTAILVYVWGSDISLATTAIDVLDGTDSAETLTNIGIRDALKLGAIINVPAATSDVAYPVLPFSIAELFGQMPKFWGLFVAHNTVAALHATAGNHVLQYYGVKTDIT